MSEPNEQWLEGPLQRLQQENARLQAALARHEHLKEGLLHLAAQSNICLNDFCRIGARQLAEHYGVGYALIARFTDENQGGVQLLALWAGRRPLDEGLFQHGCTPCTEVLRVGELYLPQQVASQYADNLLLEAMAAEGFYGLSLRDRNQRSLGVVALLDDRPFDWDLRSDPILSVYASRISAELERQRTEEQLRLAASAFDQGLEGMMVTDAEARILQVNPSFCAITGYSADEVVGRRVNILSSGRHDREFYRALWHSLESSGAWQGEIWNRRKNGDIYPEWRSIRAVQNSSGRVIRYISLFTDITDKKESERRIYQLAHYDMVTGLPNRILLQERLAQVIQVARRHQTLVGVMFIDLDGFKLINDTLGHPAGDQVLGVVSKRLLSRMRESDTVARLGGDEFVIVVTDLKQREDLLPLAREVLEVLAAPYLVEGHEALLSGSIGISLYPEDGEEVHTLIKNADAAMYQAKDAGKGTFRYFTPDLNVRSMERLLLQQRLRKALEDGEFLLHYQPQYELESGQLIGVEALLRWLPRQGSMIFPGLFITVAEESGLIVPIGAWVLRQACRQMRHWLDQGLMPGRLSVNISARQFQDPRLVETILSALEEAGIFASLLEIEITESFVMNNREEAIKSLRQLEQIGVQVAIDDFGVAYSSMGQLKHLPLSRLKIDRSFIADLPEDGEDVALTTAIVEMGHTLGMEVIAKGVETQDQADFLRAVDCDQVQGYLYGRPMPEPEFTTLLQAMP